MHRSLIYVLVASLLLALPLVPLARAAPNAKADAAAATGEKVPDFAFTTLDGRTVRKQDLLGKVVVLDFWATWCGPCVKALPELKQLQSKMKGEPFTLISVSVDDDKQGLVDFVKKNGMTWTQGWDASGRLSGGVFRVESFPTYIVLDHQGGFVYRQRGWAPGRSAQALEEQVGKALQAARKVAAKSDVAG